MSFRFCPSATFSRSSILSSQVRSARLGSAPAFAPFLSHPSPFTLGPVASAALLAPLLLLRYLSLFSTSSHRRLYLPFFPSLFVPAQVLLERVVELGNCIRHITALLYVAYGYRSHLRILSFLSRRVARVCRPVESYLLALPTPAGYRPTKASHLGSLPSCVTAQTSTLQLLQSKCNPTRRVNRREGTQNPTLLCFSLLPAGRQICTQDDPVTEQTQIGCVSERVLEKLAGIVFEIQGNPFIVPALPPAVEGPPERAAHSFN